MLKIKQDVPIEQTPTKGNYYGSGNGVTELLKLIDEKVDYRPARCDCDSGSRCYEHRLQSEIAWLRESLKKEVIRLFEDTKGMQKR